MSHCWFHLGRDLRYIYLIIHTQASKWRLVILLSYSAGDRPRKHHFSVGKCYSSGGRCNYAVSCSYIMEVNLVLCTWNLTSLICGQVAIKWAWSSTLMCDKPKFHFKKRYLAKAGQFCASSERTAILTNTRWTKANRRHKIPGTINIHIHRLLWKAVKFVVMNKRHL